MYCPCRLLRGVRLLQAEVQHLLLPRFDAEVQSIFREYGAPALPPLAQQQGEEAVLSARALGEAKRCGHVGCTNLAGISDSSVRLQRCTGCKTVRFCNAECSKAAWRNHRTACRAIQAQAAVQRATAAEHAHAC